jgi:peptide/nickel transport system permease protein
MNNELIEQRNRLYFLTVRFRVTLENWKEFWFELKGHPTALAGCLIVLLYVFIAVFASAIAPFGPDENVFAYRLAPPAFMEDSVPGYLFGGDELGRDLFSRIIYGTRISLLVGVLSVAISATIGIVLGLLAGYFRGWFDNLISRFADLLLAFPFLIFAIGIMSITGPGFGNLIMALTFKGWVEFYRLVRGDVMSEKTKEYVDAARINGRNNLYIMFREILPNIVNTIIVVGTLRIGYMVIMEASLSYLGLGIQDQAAWGSMIKAGKDYMMTAWWVSTLPGLFLLAFVLAVNLFGEGLRDILDPRLKAE